MSRVGNERVAASGAKADAMYAVERFAGFAQSFRAGRAAPQLLHHAKRAVIDWHAALFPGAVVAPAVLLERAFASELDRGEARLALGRRATVRAAALINGSAAHSVEVDDIFRDGIYHPGAPTIAAALALAQARGASGEAFLRAVIVGYEISTRIAAAMGRAHYTMSKPLHAGRAAESGVTAAFAAGEGVTGSLDVLEGDAGFGRAMGADPDWERAFATLGEDFHITRMTFKNHACCGHVFAAIDGALALQREMRVGAADIERVRVGTYKAALEVARHESPRTAAEARFSLKYTVASALVHGSVRLAAFEPARLADPATRELMRRIEVAVDPGLDAAFPAQRAARVAIEARDGRRGEHLQPTRKGDPDAPLSDAELEHKYLELASPVLGEERSRKLLARLWRLEGEAALPPIDD